MTWHVKAGGAWKEVVSGTAVKVGGVWKEVTEAYVKVGGSWKRFFSSFSVQLTDHSVGQFDFNNGTASISLVSDGRFTWVSGVNGGAFAGEWGDPITTGVGSGYECRMTHVSGVGFSTGTVGSWLSLSSNRSWSLVRITSGFSTTTGFLEIRPNGGSTIASATISLTVDVF